MNQMNKRTKTNVLEDIELIRKRMSESGLDYDNHNDFLNFMRLVRSGDVVLNVK